MRDIEHLKPPAGDGTVERLFRYPIKSMRGEERLSVRITPRGIEGDRGWALTDVETGRIVSAKYPWKWSRMLSLAARADDGLPDVTITFPNGDEASTLDPGIDERLSGFLGRAVRLSALPSGEMAIERADPIVAGQFVAEGDREVITRRLNAPVGTFFDYAPLHLITKATLARLGKLAPQSRFDVARFRANLLVDLPDQPAFVENEWARGRMYIGTQVMLELDLPTPRCAVPTLAQGDLPPDQEIIRTVARYNRISIDGAAPSACVGAYARVLQGGEINAGDTIRLELP